MAKLILTDEEKTLPFIAWSDESIGKIVKYLAAQTVTEDEHNHMLYQVSAAIILIGLANQDNADKMLIDLTNITNGNGDTLGDWRVSIELLENKQPEKLTVSDMEPGTVVAFPRNTEEAIQAIENIDKLTNLEIIYNNKKKKK